MSEAPPEALPAALAPQAVPRRLATGDTLFRPGAPARHVYFLAAGRLRLLRHGRGGEAVTIHQAGAGEYFAEAALHSERYHCAAVALQPSEVWALPSPVLKQRLATDPAFALQWAGLLSAQLRQARARIERLSLKSARERVLHLLHSEGRGANQRYRPAGTLKDLAGDLGLTHEALYRTLALLVSEGTLRRDGAELWLG